MRQALPFILFFFFSRAIAQSILINEVNFNPCCGDVAQQNFEWVELYNSSNTDTIDINGWYIRTDNSNDLSFPSWGDNELTSWAIKNPGVMPLDLVANKVPYIINSTKIPPGKFAIILDPTYNTPGYANIDIPDSAIILTFKTYKNFGSDYSNVVMNGVVVNGLFYNTEDVVMLFNGNPSSTQSLLLDSVAWKNNSQKPGCTLQRDNDCIFRWHSSSAYSQTGGYVIDTDNSLLLAMSPGKQNFERKLPSINGNDSLCFGEVFKFLLPLDTLACGEYSVEWNFGDVQSTTNIVLSGLDAEHTFSDTGSFVVSVKLTYGDLKSVVYRTVYVSPQPAFSLGSDTVLCSGDMILLQAYDGVSYMWNDQSIASSLVVQAAGIYAVEVINAYGCKTSDSIHVTYYSLPFVFLGNDTTLCENQSLLLSPAKFESYTWSDSSKAQTFLVSKSGTYAVEVTDKNGCQGIDSINISFISTPLINLGNDTSLCSGTTLVIMAPTGYNSYSWSNASTGTTLSVYSSGIYTLNVTDANGCMGKDSIKVEEIPLPLVSFMVNNICEGEQPVFKNFSSFGAYSWNLGDNNFSSDLNPIHTYVQPGNYTVALVVENAGCVDSMQSTISVYEKPNIGFEINAVTGCMPLQVQFIDTTLNAKKYIWNFGDGKLASSPMPLHTYQDSGFFSVSLTVISKEGCSSQFIKENAIQVYPLPKADFEMDRTELKLTSPDVKLKNNSSGASIFYWYYSDGTVMVGDNPPLHSFNDTGMYSIKQIVENQYGCQDSIEKSIHVLRDYEVFVPTAFTPNNDGINDIFKPKGIGLKWYEYSFVIYNRWGEMLFFTSSPLEGWDGKIKNTLAKDDTYTWKITITDKKDGEIKNFSGLVSLLK